METTNKTLEERISALERSAERQAAYKDCLELMVKYQIFHHLTTRRIDVEENAEKNRENARLSVKTPTKNVEKVAYSGTHHKKTEYRNHKPRSN